MKNAIVSTVRDGDPISVKIRGRDLFKRNNKVWVFVGKTRNGPTWHMKLEDPEGIEPEIVVDSRFCTPLDPAVLEVPRRSNVMGSSPERLAHMKTKKRNDGWESPVATPSCHTTIILPSKLKYKISIEGPDIRIERTVNKEAADAALKAIVSSL